LHEVASHGGGMAATSTVHINLFGPQSDRRRRLRRPEEALAAGLVEGKDQCCFGFTEPMPALNTTAIKTFAQKVPGGYIVHGQKVWTSTGTRSPTRSCCSRARPSWKTASARPMASPSSIPTSIAARSRCTGFRRWAAKAVDSNSIFIDGLFIPDSDRVGEEGKGFGYVLHSLNPERVLIAAEPIGIARTRWRRATNTHEKRVSQPPDRPNRASSNRWPNMDGVEAAWAMTMKAAWLYDRHQPCGAEANTAKFLGARAGYEACERPPSSPMAGFGYAKEYHVERLFREVHG